MRSSAADTPGSTVMTCDGRVLDRLRADHPGWDIWWAGWSARWLATRKGVLSAAEMRAGLLHTLVGDTAEHLRSALADQRRIELGVSREPAW